MEIIIIRILGIVGMQFSIIPEWPGCFEPIQTAKATKERKKITPGINRWEVPWLWPTPEPNSWSFEGQPGTPDTPHLR